MLFMACVCHAFASVHCCLVVTWREKADLLALVFDVYCYFVTFPFGILGQVWYLIVLIPDPFCLSYFIVSYNRKYVHKVQVKRLVKLAMEKKFCLVKVLLAGKELNMKITIYNV